MKLFFSKEKVEHLEKVVASKWHTLSTYDVEITTYLFKYQHVTEYFNDTRTQGLLDQVSVPTFVLQS